MKAVILAGGLGTRISEETAVRPKPMIEIGGKPILWHILKIYSHYGINEFIICCGYKGYVIKEYFANYFLHTSDVTFDMSTNAMEVHSRKAEPWRVTLVDTGDSTLTGGRLHIADHGRTPWCNGGGFIELLLAAAQPEQMHLVVAGSERPIRLVNQTRIPDAPGLRRSQGDRSADQPDIRLACRVGEKALNRPLARRFLHAHLVGIALTHQTEEFRQHDQLGALGGRLQDQTVGAVQIGLDGRGRHHLNGSQR